MNQQCQQSESPRYALVTGAASGLGRAVALKMAQLEIGLCLVDIDSEGLARTARDAAQYGVQVMEFTADLSTPETCYAAVDSALTTFGKLDILCNVAGVMAAGHTTEISATAFQQTLAINLAAPFYIIQRAIPHLLETSGSIINIASAVGISAQAYNAAYCATKAGLIQMTKALAMEYMHSGIRINAIAPGGMMTPLIQCMRTLENTDMSLLARTSPLRGVLEPDEIAETVMFLISEAARGYHGSCLVIDNGMCAG